MKIFHILLLIIPLLASCAKAPPKTALSPARLQEAGRALENYRNQAPIHTLSAFAQATLRYHGRTQSFDAALLLKSPDQLRIELIDDLGQTVARLVADGRMVLWEDIREGTRELFIQNDGSLKKALRLPLTVEEFIAGMSLQIPSNPPVNIWSEGGEEIIDRDGDRIGWDPAAARLLEYSRKKMNSEKRLRYSVQYKNYLPSSRLPERILWKFFSPGFLLDLTLKEVTVNEPLPSARFHTQAATDDPS